MTDDATFKLEGGQFATALADRWSAVVSEFIQGNAEDADRFGINPTVLCAVSIILGRHFATINMEPGTPEFRSALGFMVNHAVIETAIARAQILAVAAEEAKGKTKQ